jgi:hypothetical protein
MKSSESDSNPGFINFSYTVFYHLAVLGWLPFFIDYFPTELHTIVRLILISMPIVLFWLVFLIMYHIEVDPLMWCIVAYVSICAVCGFLSAYHGPISDQSLPIINILFLGSYVIVSTFYAAITASVVVFYAILISLLSILIASFLEFVYVHTLAKVIPKIIQKPFIRFDKSLDDGTVNILGAPAPMNQNVGLYIAIGLLTIFTLFYLLILNIAAIRY